ncbi:MIP/aquaporin family protein [Microbacterium sp. ARD31]|uniref:MIP/aquaporin family protein n=1 Tax=Microbacterium sp. ARD31 TaxID=2962576 RepID=UPI0028814AEB|nr:MIP/aquaporin family protein [Microbacterium sp. ARD31]MDT0182174.1 MIP/aquaporin family protein [Microbacterium sp. ARD31]
MRRLAAEFLGTGMLVTVVVGSGIAAQRLSPNDVGLQLLENSLVTALGLAVLILLVGPVSGAHLNPAVSLADWVLSRRRAGGLSSTHLGAYVAAQITGGVAGTLLASVMFDVAPTLSTTPRATAGHLVGEVVATAGLVLLVFALARTTTAAVTAAAVGAYIGAAYWFTSSTSFANPAVTVARIFTDTFTGIAPASVMPFILAQLVGAAVGVALLLVLYPTADRTAARAVVPIRPDSTPQEHS